jgi:hypothetical protein
MALDEKGDEPEDDGDQVISGSPMDQTSRVSPLDATPQPLSLDEAKELIRLCETGRLYEVEVWIAAGKSLTVPNGGSIVVESWSESDTCPPAIPCGRWQEWQWK